MSIPDLKRFSESRIRTSKLTTFVNFPLRDLDLREFASENTSEYFSAGRAEARHQCLRYHWEAKRWRDAAEESHENREEAGGGGKTGARNASGVVFPPQTTLFTTCMLCPITPEPPWAAITQPTAGVQ